MKQFLAPILLLTLLFPALAMGETMDDLVITNGLYYKKYTEVPFTGKVTGKTQGSFKNGKKHGFWVEYDRDGRVSKKVSNKNGKENTYVEYRYYDNGQLHSKVTYKEGKEDGPWIEYHKNGKLDFKGTYKDGKRGGPWVYYHKDGQLRYKGNWKNDKRDGPWVSYHDDGQLKFKGNFKDGKKIFD